MKTKFLIFTAFAGLACSALATPQLRLSDGTTTITVVDGDLNDQQLDPGVVYYNGPVGSNWKINITVGVSKPADGTPSEPFMDLDTTSLSSSAGDLSVELTDTDFTAVSGTFDAVVGGTTDGSVEFKYFLDDSNTPFGTNSILADFPNQTDVYGSGTNGNYTVSGPFSLTIQALIHHNAAGSTGFDENLELTGTQFQPPTIQCSGDQDLGCNPASITSCDTNSITVTASCGVSNITCSTAGPDIVTGCIHERDLVYTVTDNCGQSASCTQHIYWTVDNTPPTFDNCPGDRDLGCNPPSIPDCSLDVTASDDCSAKAFVSCSSSDSVDGCAHTRTITYVASDKCGNKATCVQHVTWTVDTTAPTFTKCADDKDLGCNPATIPDCDTNSVTATDDCTLNPTVSCSSSDATNGCGRTRTITYIATDACGNTASCVQHITWTVDTTAPTFTKCADDKDLGCNPAGIPGCDTTTVAATDDCTANPNITCSSVDATNGCGRTRTITYVATDACGNSSSCVQHITWTVDTTAPTFTKCAADKDLGCNPASVPDCDTSSVTATDDCTANPRISCSSVDATNGCGRTRTITYVATDACGNSSSCVQHITWTVNTTAPTFTKCADDQNLGCNPTSIPTGDITSVTATDDCSTPTITKSYVDSTNSCGRTRTITYTATDGCGNTATCVQHITWSVNTTKPTITRCAPDRNLGCNPTSIPVGTNSLVSANDDCGNVTVTNSYVDSSSGCNHTRTITYVVTDACGNTATCVQHITWTVDTVPPTFTTCPSDMTVSVCDASCAKVTYSASATDNCGGTATVTFSPASGSCLPSGTNAVTATATDACGNKTTKTFKVIVQPGGCYITFTPGGWGAPPNGGNVAQLLANTFKTMYPNGVVVGGSKTITMTSAYAVQVFLPSGGTPGVLKYSYTNPTSGTEAGEFASQVLALKFNCDYSNAGLFKVGLTSLHVAPGYPLAGYTVQQVLTLCNTVLGGKTSALPSGVTVSQLTTLCSGINGNYDGGLTNNGVLVP